MFVEWYWIVHPNVKRRIQTALEQEEYIQDFDIDDEKITVRLKEEAIIGHTFDLLFSFGWRLAYLDSEELWFFKTNPN